MRIDHIFDAVGYQVARGQRIEHAIVPHRDAVIDRDGVEFLGDPARRLDLARDHLSSALEVNVAGHALGNAVDHRDRESDEWGTGVSRLLWLGGLRYIKKQNS